MPVSHRAATAGLLALLAVVPDASAEQRCFGSGSERYCRDVRPDGSAPPGYRYTPPYDTRDPNLAPGGARITPLNTLPSTLQRLPVPGRASQ